ncbi:diguanylate cyclase [Halomonas sp. YLGW01]|uniref:GGDEF domain-containing protein n=1 Tax=Halomonas sp. YLGW01 TaxID=2773308 RepID=UPI00177C3D69|nr:diguanylate cyclase [Halomonas sp. YLGW01]
MRSALHSLRYRFVLALLGVLVIALIALAGFTHIILKPELLRSEDLLAQEALARAQRAIDNEARHLDMLTKDWATWDDSYQFMRDGNPHYLASNIADATIFEDADLSAIAFLTPAGQLFWLSGLDPQTGAYHACADLDARCRWARPYLDASQARIAHSRVGGGMAWLQTHPQQALVSVQPILHSDGSGPLAGWLAMVRPMNGPTLTKLRDSTGLAISVLRASHPGLEALSVQRLNDTAMRATTFLAASPPGERLALHVELPRQHLASRLKNLALGQTWTIGLLVVVLLVVLLLLERIVLRPLRVFAAFTRRVRRPERTDVPAPLLARHDEIGTLARHFQQLIEFQRQQKAELVDLSERDPLTGLANRRRFDDHLESALAAEREQSQSTALLVIDIDRYKAFNDRYGHPAGDACLRQLAGVMNTHFEHPGQLVARTGGEEFMAVLPATTQASALFTADRLRAAIEALAIPHSGQVVTISVGVACSTPERPLNADGLIEAADQALYAAKAAGRNRTLPAESLE